MIRNILLAGLGGGIGSVARYLCQKWFNETYPHPFPWGTFVVNLLGCFLIGIIYGASEKSTVLSPQTRLFLATGFCGGFTTFSTFAFENMNLLRTGDTTYLLLYTMGSVLLGILGVFAGTAIMKFL
ncbi:MAG: fluoride efflux transporter CrcB [Bacteroidota bacterium]|nr:fluoride efflux transporter CrcB [Bacteroidota bacterium]